jgi:hypothetical protein
MEDLKKMAATTALNTMLADRHFSICTVDAVARMLNVIPAGDAYNILRTVHRIDYDKMPAALREKIPELIQSCLGVAPVYQFKTMDQQVIEVTPRRGLLRMLGG